MLLFVCISNTADGPQRARLTFVLTATLSPCLSVVTKDLPGSRLLILLILLIPCLSRCKFSTLTLRQPMIEFYLLTIAINSHAFRDGNHNKILN